MLQKYIRADDHILLDIFLINSLRASNSRIDSK